MEPDDLLSDASLDAAVSALAARNQHHLGQMTPQEQGEALAHWRELALDVLRAARAAGGGEGPREDGDPGRAVIVFEDAGQEDVAVHVTFWPELQEVGGDQIAGTPAQLTAVALLESLQQGGEGEPPVEG